MLRPLLLLTVIAIPIVLGAVVGFVDGAYGSLLAYRLGVMAWPAPPTRAFLLRGGAFIAALCAVWASPGAMLLLSLPFGRAG